MSASLAHDQLPNVAAASGRPLLPKGRPENPDAVGYVQVTDEIHQVESPQVGVAKTKAATETPPVEADGNAVAGAPQVAAGDPNNDPQVGAGNDNRTGSGGGKPLLPREVIEIFIHDLKTHPFANEEDVRKIKALPADFLASKLNKFKTDLSTGFLKHMPGRGALGEEICPVHSRVKSCVLFDLIKCVRDETWKDSRGFFDARLENKFVKLLINVNLVWDEKFFKGKIIVPPNDSLVLFNPYAEHKLFQLKDCAGCFLRRILSDPRCVFALLAAAEFGIRFDRIPEKNAPHLYRYMETAWQILATEYPDLWETVGNPDAVRRRVSTDVRALVVLAREYERSD
jgi:hypothetical protein